MSGTAAMSVDRYVVTPSMRLAGTRDSVTQRARRPSEIESPVSPLACAVADRGIQGLASRPRIAMAHAHVNAANRV